MGFTGVITHFSTWDVGRTREKLVNHERKPRSRVGYHADKPIESVVYIA